MMQSSSEGNPSPDQLQQAVVDQELFDRLAESLCRYGLRLPALVALEAGRPLAFLGGQLLWIAQPALSLFFSGQTVQHAAQILEEPMALEALVARLEARKAE